MAREILIVDASRFFREGLCEALEAAGHGCATAEDLVEAEARLGEPDLALVVLDLGSTGEGGLDLLRTLRERRPAVRSIVLAPHASQDQVLEALRLGASDYLAKPLHDEELLLSVGRALEAHRTTSELEALRAAAEPATGSASGPLEDADLDLVREICELSTRGGAPDACLQAILAAVADRFEAAPVSLYLQDPSGQGWRREVEHDGGRRGDRERLPAGRGLSGAAAGTGVFLAARDPSQDPRFDPEVDRPEIDPEAEGGAPGPILCLPLRIRERPVGLVRVFPAPGHEPSLRSAEATCAALSAALRSVLLYRSWLSSVDEVARIRREGAPGRAPTPRVVPGREFA